MLNGLCGNKNIEKILIFLFVNNRCYGTQLQKLLGEPLTTLQNALARLEKGKIIVGHFERKRKFYQLNQDYPLHSELEQLLKKAYMLLAPEQKNMFSLAKLEGKTKKNQISALLAFWKKLHHVKSFTRLSQTKSKEGMGWNKKGIGKVCVSICDKDSLIFHEKGFWQEHKAHEMNFSNTFRWTLNRNEGTISLEHLRLGFEHPVFLFHLMPTAQHLLVSVDAHLCNEDVYLATVPWDNQSIRLNWRVIGPKKNEEMEYCYVI